MNGFRLTARILPLLLCAHSAMAGLTNADDLRIRPLPILGYDPDNGLSY